MTMRANSYLVFYSAYVCVWGCACVLPLLFAAENDKDSNSDFFFLSLSLSFSLLSPSLPLASYSSFVRTFQYHRLTSQRFKWCYAPYTIFFRCQQPIPSSNSSPIPFPWCVCVHFNEWSNAILPVLIMLRIATVTRTSSGYHSHRSGEQVKEKLISMRASTMKSTGFYLISSAEYIYTPASAVAEWSYSGRILFEQTSKHEVRRHMYIIVRRGKGRTAHDLVATFDRERVPTT